MKTLFWSVYLFTLLLYFLKGLKYPGMPSFAPDEPGQIFMMDLNEQNPRVQALAISDGFDKASFNPHGISTFIDKGKAWKLRNKGEWGKYKPLISNYLRFMWKERRCYITMKRDICKIINVYQHILKHRISEIRSDQSLFLLPPFLLIWPSKSVCIFSEI